MTCLQQVGKGSNPLYPNGFYMNIKPIHINIDMKLTHVYKVRKKWKSKKTKGK